MTPTTTLFDWRAQRDAAIAQAIDAAPPNFKSQAMRFVVDALRAHGQMSGEGLTDAVWSAGITARDRRAMGSVLMTLIRDGIIEKCGACKRLRGHGTGGGSIYRIKA